MSAAQLQADRAVSTPDAPQTNPLLGIEYMDAGYGGATLTLYGTSGSGCYNGVTYGFATMPSGWNDDIGAAKGYSGCYGSHYQNSYYGGAELTCRPNCSSMGLLNDQTSSIAFR